MIEFDESKQSRRIDDLYKKEEEELVQLLADRYGIPYIDLSAMSIETDALRTIPEDVSRSAGIAAFKSIAKKLYVVIQTPNNQDTKVALEDLERKGFILSTFMCSKASLERAWGFYKDLSLALETKAGVLDIASDALTEMMDKMQNVDDVRSLIFERMQNSKGHKVSIMLEILIAGALATKASDIHVEPEDKDVRVRFRLDGLLTEIYAFDFDTYKLLTSRIKLLSGLKINVRDNAQDGRFSITIGDTEIEIRTSLMPGAYGESIVLRVLNPDNINVPFEGLGIEPRLFSILEHAISKPNGIILNTGPTGSGKTTTLYAILQKVHNEDNKILTIEDPIEYHIQGITQTQVEEGKGYTFLNGLRAALRQDPDIIMVGEIRDGDTAKVAINSALTGHLVLSTLHTNSAAGAIPRLLELGVNPKVLSSALSVALAQRLVRKVCSNCKTPYTPIAPEVAIIQNTLETMIANGKGESIPEGFDINNFVLYRGGGCEKCNKGYKGRLGIYEAVIMDEYLERALGGEYPSEREIKEAVLPQKVLTLKEDAVIKVLKGITTLEEVGKAVDLYE